MSNVKGQCHCGAVRYTYRAGLTAATRCNCSICRKLGAVWIYGSLDEITITGPTNRYTRQDLEGDPNLTIHRCPTCGATTHWSPLKPGLTKMAVNLMLAEPGVIAKVKIRDFDGAETWRFLDEDQQT